MNLSRFLAPLTLLFLLSPFLVLIFKFPLDPSVDLEEFRWALKNTVWQATLSGLGSLLLGTWLAFGLVGLSTYRRAFEVLSLLPNFLPPLFTLLVSLYWLQPFPTGIWGVAIVHTFINFGLVGVSLSRSMDQQLGHLVEAARTLGSGRWFFLRKVFFPLFRRQYLSLFLFVFSICFSSFSVPLIIGGGRGTTLEVLIYEKIRLSVDWGSAVLLSMFQFAFLALLSWFLLKKQNQDFSVISGRSLRWLGHRGGVVMLVAYALLFTWGFLESAWTGLKSWEQFIELRFVLAESLLGTLWMGLSVGVLILLLLAAISWDQGSTRLQTFLRSYVAPSTTLTGFAFLVLGPNEGMASYLKIPVALSLLFVGPLYRMGWENELVSLRGQVQVALSLGASEALIFWKILWPQLRGRAFLLAGLAAAWACGDFAVSRILAYKDLTLGMMTETFMSTYRLNLAMLLSCGILICSLGCFLFFWSWNYVGRPKS